MPAAAVTAVLAHSPFLGPASLRPLADALAALGHPTVLLDLLPSVAAAPVHQRLIGAFADALSDAALTGPIAIVGHSGAGPLLPAFAEELEDDVRALVYLDAGLPTPGRSWRDTATAAEYADLRDRSRDGILPHWPQWSPTDPLAAVTDPALRAEITDEAPEVPLAYLKEPHPTVEWTGPTGYVRLSADHAADADTARANGWPVRAADLHHLAAATHPEPVARLVLAVLLELLSGD
ncbi:alpha/beta hydrolase [Actinokineospora inagensis]|uniref:alpha/beta hydrolase n=1 Tax=Actinokineospora inagensis TaxID=103730 RepID=UPI0003FA5E67|nr:alpha/beta hydrolase [Actinokineospora inagensis]